MDNKLVVSQSPHIQSKDNIQKIMLTVIIALLPATLFSFYLFGIKAFMIVVIAVGSAVLFEWLTVKYVFKNNSTVWDLSAIVTGLLLALNVPSNLPIWMLLVGTFVAIVVVKLTFGGLGQNIFNPAIAARIFLLISFPVQMTSWPLPFQKSMSMFDAVTGPTSLGIMKEGLKNGETVSQIMDKIPSHLQMLYGIMGGSLGEVSALLIILGGIYLMIRKVITWHIPVSILSTVTLFSTLMWTINPNKYPDPLFELLTGGLMIGAFFMATDYSTSPMSKSGQIIFGIAIGLLTLIIRYWGAYPEGISFAILIMNAFVPLINKSFKPNIFGKIQKKKQ